MKTYFDELAIKTDPTSIKDRDAAKKKGTTWMDHCVDFVGNLDVAFRLWDAVSPSFRCVCVCQGKAC